MSAIYVVRSFASSTAFYDDPDGNSNYCVLDTMDRLHRNREFTYNGGEAAFKSRQTIYEELLRLKHGASEVTRLQESSSTFIGRKDTEIYRMVFNDGFILIKEVTVEYCSDHVDKNVTYYLPKEGWNEDDPTWIVDSIGWIHMYRMRV